MDFLRRSLSQELSAILTDCRPFPALLTASPLQHLVCSVDILGLFLPLLSISWPISPLRGEYLFHHIQNVFLPFFPAFYHPNHLINPVQSLLDQPSSDHPISPIFGFLVSLFLFLFWSYPAFHILANLS